MKEDSSFIILYVPLHYFVPVGWMKRASRTIDAIASIFSIRKKAKKVKFDPFQAAIPPVVHCCVNFVEQYGVWKLPSSSLLLSLTFVML